jgi:hypothetical protein
MKRILNRYNLIVVILIIIFSAAAFFAGGIIGFDKGFEAKSFYDGIDGYYTVTILRALREGKDDLAISKLELHLNTQIFQCGLFSESPDSIFNINRWTESYQKSTQSVKTLMQEVAKYRKEYPYPLPDIEVQKIIDNTLEKYYVINDET